MKMRPTYLYIGRVRLFQQSSVNLKKKNEIKYFMNNSSFIMIHYYLLEYDIVIIFRMLMTINK